jgi:hypothetical protein
MGVTVGNYWQPTFVHEDNHPRGQFPHYVMPDGSFVKLRGNSGPEYIAHACELIAKHGVRDPRGYSTCQRYTDIQGTCQRGPSDGNSTCARFFTYLDAGGV